jgi:hypothetical protein
VAVQPLDLERDVEELAERPALGADRLQLGVLERLLELGAGSVRDLLRDASTSRSSMPKRGRRRGSPPSPPSSERDDLATRSALSARRTRSPWRGRGRVDVDVGIEMRDEFEALAGRAERVDVGDARLGDDAAGRSRPGPAHVGRAKRMKSATIRK